MSERAGTADGAMPDLSDLSEVSNVLLLAPSLGGHGREVCFDLLAQTPPAETNVLVTSYTQTPGEVVDDWNDHVGTAPVRGGVVSVGQGEDDAEDSSWAVKSVENPSDLTGVGIELSEFLSGIASATEEGEHVAVCFNSITSLLQYADLQRAFRFLHVVTGRIKTVGGVGHFHLDPDAHDTQTVATLKGLFDAVVEVDDDGSWDVQQ